MPKDITKKSKKGTSEPFVIPPIPTRPRQCHFFVLRKRRYCGLPAKTAQNYCGEHANASPNNETDVGRKRIPCPYDNSHTVFEKDLEQHMKKRCNARPRELPPYHSLNVNCTLPLSQEELDFQKNIYSHQKMFVQPWLARVQLSELSKDDLNSIVKKISTAYDQHVQPIETEVLTHPSAEKKRPFIKHVKHLDQLSSLIGHMEKNDMLKDKSACFAEFGAGKGDLSGYVKKALQEENGEATYLLLDRKSVRNKVDMGLLGQSENKSTVQRLLIDIKDLNLSKVDCLANNKKNVVAISKHLCGCATDISLVSLMHYVEQEKANGHSNPVTGIIVALCCHQICRYEMYPNIEYLDSLNISKVEFERMCKMSSWSSCSYTKATTKTGEEEEEEEDEHVTEADDENNDQTSNHFSGLDVKEREAIGYQCKRVIDTGRVKYLEKYGFDVKLVYYVNPVTSLENCALIATPKVELK